jgi:HK97 family phage portal protein
MEATAAVEACIAANAQTIAQLPFNHWRDLPNGGRERVTTSAASRVLRRPNEWQSRADFFHNLLRQTLYTGNGYAVGTRNARFEIDSLYAIPSRGTKPVIEERTGEVFYQIPDCDLIPSPPEGYTVWPSRDVLHLKLYTPHHPLIGVTPLTAAELANRTSAIISQGVAAFMGNMARPGGYLAVPEKVQMSDPVMENLRTDFTNASTGAGQGRIPALRYGIKFEPLKMDAFDEAIVSAQKLNIADIARVFRTPLPVIGELGGATFTNTESLVSLWKATGLGFLLDSTELALDNIFGLPPDEYIEADIEVLLRADFASRMDGLTKAVSGGIYAPNEARRKEGLPDAKAGDEPRLQAQVVPLSAAELAKPAPSAPAAPVAPADAADEPPAPAPPSKLALPEFLAAVKGYDSAARR